MKPLPQTEPYKLELREGGGLGVVLFGLPFFLGGVGLAAGALGFVRIGPGSDPLLTRLACGVMSPVFLVLGAVIMFGRIWVTFDRSLGTVVRHRGLVVPMTTERRQLSDFAVVAVEREAGDTDRYPVKLAGRSGDDFPISSSEQFAKSRKQAEDLSQFLGLPLADRTAGTRCKVRESGGQATIEIPGDRVTVTASASGLVIERPGGRQVIASGDLLEIGYGTGLAPARGGERAVGPAAVLAVLKKWIPSKGIVVKTRREMIGFGESLPSEELAIVRSVLQRALRGL